MPKFKKNPSPAMKKRSGFTMKRGSSPLYKDLGSSPIEQDPPVIPDPTDEDKFEGVLDDTGIDKDIVVKERTDEEKEAEKIKIQKWLDRAEQEIKDNPPEFPPIKM
tara:strand:- start:234 stop:551 length:318 start_codon:yes stop_codon:yes gene_type:complete